MRRGQKREDFFSFKIPGGTCKLVSTYPLKGGTLKRLHRANRLQHTLIMLKS